MPLEVKDPGIAVVDGQIIVTGGWSSEGKYSRHTLKYDPRTDKWISCEDIPASRQRLVNSTVAVNQKVYVLAHQDFHIHVRRLQGLMVHVVQPTATILPLCHGSVE